ncbi:MAG: inositol monophosphatase family protein [Muribaculaceae bacterium]|nr:inositol monophosphatase family protein [Muribaculaceae bacterium]
MAIDVDELLINAISWAKEAGKVQLTYFRGTNLNIQAKLNESDIVTAADKESERIIISHIHSLYPSHSILSEESGEESNSGEYQWVIDPLDGTTNFSSGLPQFCVSIGLKYNGTTIMGVVFAPYLNELYTSVRGEGAYLNGEKIHVGSETDISRAVVSTGFPVDKSTNADNNLDNLSRVLPQVRGMRRMGSAAIDICSVSAGFLDAYWELNLHEWDVCAGLLIAEEAGAKVDFFREDRNVSVLVSSPAIGKIILPLLSKEPNY